MAYTAPGAMTFRRTGGDLDKKITDELGKIDTELDGLTDAVVNIGYAAMKVLRITLTAKNADAFSFAYPNPFAQAMVIFNVSVYITTGGGTAGSVIDIGVGAAATTHADNIIDGLAVDTAGVFDNITNKGTNGKTSAVLGVGQYLTGQILTQNAATLAGVVFVTYATPSA